MQEEFASDVMADFLQREFQRQSAESEHRRNRRFWFLSVLGTGILAALSVGTLVKQVLEGRHFLSEIGSDPLAALDRQEGPAIFGLVVGLIVMIGVCIGGYLKRPPKHGAAGEHEAEGFADEARKELTIHKSLGEL